jgi:tetratricopeptide (TPR) repeat protein
MDTRQDLPRARQMLEKALALDHSFAYARACYGLTDLLMIDSGASNDTSWLYRAEANLRRALEDDPGLAQAYATLAYAHIYQGRQDLALQEVRRAIELDPEEKEGATTLAIYHQYNGEYEQSQALVKRLLEIDPFFFPARLNLGENLRQMGDPAGSIREQEKVLEQDPTNIPALMSMGMAYLTQGNAVKARETLARARSLEPQNYQVRLLWALLLAVEGRREEAMREMDAELLKFGELIIFSSIVAEFHAVLGDRAAALDWLDRAARSGDGRAEWFERDPLLASVRGEPRFRQIVDGIRYRREQRNKPA